MTTAILPANILQRQVSRAGLARPLAMAAGSGTGNGSAARDCHAQLAQLFDACDRRRCGYIEAGELRAICSDELTDSQIRDVFRRLDRDGDGRVSKDDFCAGFSETVLRRPEWRRRRGGHAESRSDDDTLGRPTREEGRRGDDEEESTDDANEFLSCLDKDLQALSW